MSIFEQILNAACFAAAIVARLFVKVHGTPLALWCFEQSESKGSAMILISDTAVSAVKQAMAQAGQHNGGLRIHVKEGGCAGYQYVVDLDREQRADDIVVEADGIRVFIDPASSPRLAGMTLGYKQGLEGEGFTLENPNATSTCGCKKSFN